METTIYSFNAKDVRLQYVKVFEDNDPNWFFEIRFNRKLIERFPRSSARLSRFQYSHIICELILHGISPLCHL